jgi:hypothetical protein
MKRYLLLAGTFAAATGIGFGFRHVLSGAATASRDAEARPEPRARSTARHTDLDAPADEEVARGLRFAAAGSPADGDGAELLVARMAYDCGNFLLGRARQAPGSAHTLRQAAQHFRACLSHEGSVRDAGSLFADARRNLEVAERLLAEGNRLPARVAEQLPAPTPKVEAGPAPEAGPPAPGSRVPKMVGPDGVIYEPVEEAP